MSVHSIGTGAGSELSSAKRLLLEKRLRGAGSDSARVIPRDESTGPAPLAPVQHAMWVLNQLLPDNSVYSVHRVLRLRGALDRSALRAALDDLVARHEALRTTYPETAPPVQVVAPPSPAPLEVVDLTDLPVARRPVLADQRARAELARPFDLAQGPPFRAMLLRLDTDEHLLVLNVHHIASDEWTFTVLAEDLSSYYAARLHPETAATPAPLAIRYADYARWQSNRLAGGLRARQLAYWREALGAVPHILELPSDRPRPAVPSYRGGTVSRTLAQPLSAAIRELGTRHGATAFSTLLAAFAVVLHLYSGQPRFAIGTMLSGRMWAETEPLVGLFANIVAIPVDLFGQPSFIDLVNRTHRSVVGGFDHQDVTFEQVVQELGVERDSSRNPVFQVLFQSVEAAGTPWSFPGQAVESIDLAADSAKVDLALFALVAPDEITLQLTYATDLFTLASATRLLDSLTATLDAVIAAPATSLAQLALPPARERDAVVRRLNDTATPYPADATVPGLFEAAVERDPAAPAIIEPGGTVVSYGELNQRANQLAYFLRDRGVGPESFVGLCLDHSPELFVALLAILKAGAAYVPLDAKHPQDRQAYILADTGARLVVTSERIAATTGFPGRLVCLDRDSAVLAEFSMDNPPPAATAENLVYAMYTSGSTGRPKGVLISHRGLVNYLWWAVDGYGLPAGSGAPMLGSIAFDLSIPNFLLPLIGGKAVTLLPEDRSLESLAAQLARPGDFSLLKVTPGHLDVLRGMLDAASVRSVGTFVVGADEVRPETVAAWRRIAPGAHIVNEYGPTETVVGCSVYPIPPDFDPSVPVSIGRPIANTQMYVLDGNLALAPTGVVGELFIGGDGVARGYLNLPRLTADRFLPDPFSDKPGARLYRTGDLARLRPDGNLDFLGRIDHQVKIRGYRIELGEIEARLLRHPGVSEAVVTAWEPGPGDRRLAAHVVPLDGAELDERQLRQFLEQSLPDYMVPAVFQVLGALPLSPGGKVDRSKLVPSTGELPGPSAGFVAPQTPTQRALAGIWAGLLRRARVGARDNFFELGGDSITAIQVVAQARQLGLRLRPRQIFTHQSIAELAAALDGEAGDPADTTDRAEDLAGGSTGDAAPLPVDIDDNPGVETVALDPRIAGPLAGVAVAARAAAEVALLTALARTMTGWTGADRVQVDVYRGDGITRLQLVPGSGSAATSLAAVRSQLRADPRPDSRGTAAARPPAQVGFSLHRGGAPDPALGQHPISVVTTISTTGAQLRWYYDAQRFRESTIRRLAGSFVAELANLVQQAGLTGGRLLPSEFPLAGLDQASLDLLVAQAGPRDIADIYPTTPLQAGMLFHTLVEPHGYLRQFTIDIGDDLDIDAFRGAWEALADRHAVLRTRFVWGGVPHPVQVVERRLEVTLRELDLRALTAADRYARLEQLLLDERRREFDLSAAPPSRFTVVRTGEHSHRVIWSTHHIVLDGWSIPILFEELFAIYDQARTGGRPPRLPDPVPFRDYVAWLSRRDPASDDAYWRENLAGFDAPTPLPASQPQSDATGAGVERLVLSEESTQALVELARANRVTVSSVLHAAWGLLLSRYSGEADVVFGTTQAGRSVDIPGVDRIVGLLINTVPVRIHIDRAASIEEWLHAVHDQLIEIRDREHCAIVDIQRCTDIPSGERLFQTIFGFNGSGQESAPPAGVTVTGTAGFGGTGYPLAFDVTLGDRLQLELSYNLDRYSKAVAAQLLAHYAHLLTGLRETGRAVGDVQMASVAELTLLTRTWNDTTRPYPADLTIPERFEAVACRTPDAVALDAGGRTMTYRELDEAANQLACLLRQRGIRADATVAVALPRSLDLVVALLAVLKAGGAYVALDPSNPPARNAVLLDDSGARVVIANRDPAGRVSLPELAPSTIVLDLDHPDTTAELAVQPRHPAPSAAFPASLAYISYTSGSTGTPKGVGVPHRAVIRLIHEPGYATFGPEDTFLLLAPTAFDASTLELWGSLLNGARLALAPSGPLAIDELATVLREFQVTMVVLTTGLFHQLVEHDPASVRGLRYLLTGGDVLAPQAFRTVLDHNPGLNLIAGYGPTENTTLTTCQPVTDSGQIGTRVPIGRPVPQTTTYVLDDQLRPVPIGVTGELYTGGDGLARGYLNQPRLSAERFVPDPFAKEPGARLYRTGDLARYRPDGVMDFITRVDNQVKIRGFRVELGEIESRLLQHPDIVEVMVLARAEASGHKQVVAYVAPRPGTMPSVADLRRHVQQALPEYMVPAAVVVLERLPLNRHGKVDRKALPPPDPARSRDLGAPAAPASATERALAGIWARVLGLDEIGVHDSFFELGGDSILALRIVAQARQDGLTINPRLLFEHPTLAELGAAVDRARSAVVPVRAQQDDVTGTVPLTPIQRWFADSDWHHDHFNQSIRLRWPGRCDAELLTAALRHLMRHHDALRLRLVHDHEGWHQHLDRAERADLLQVCDLSALAVADRSGAARAAADAAHRGVQLAQGPLLRAVLFRMGYAEPDAVLISIHHLAVDVVSWDIIVEDLIAVYDQLQRGSAVRLPAKTTSFRQWAQRLVTYASSDAFAAEADFWQAYVRPTAPLPLDLPVRPNLVARAATVTATLPGPRTAALLREVPAAYRTQVNDLLLTALARTLCAWTGERSAGFTLEGHGREPLFNDLDISRTVGWFTAVHPLYLQLPDGDDPGAALKAVKEQIRAVPLHGIGYGLARHLRADPAGALAEHRLPQLSFNYLGQLTDEWTSDGPARLSTIGQEVAPATVRPHLIEVVTSTIGGRLHTHWTYCRDLHLRGTIQRLADDFVAQLEALVQHCVSGHGGVTPSDFPLAGLDQEALDRLFGGVDARQVDDVYPLSPLQAGMLFQTVSRPGSAEYVGQSVYTIDGELDSARFLQAWQHTIDHHPALRSTFVWDTARPVQIVHRRVMLQAEQLDWRDVPEDGIPDRLSALMARERERGFDLSAAAPQRFHLIRTGERRHLLVWHNHHIIIDGWSVPIILDEVYATYDSLTQHDRLPELPAAPPYRRYIGWLAAQDPDVAEAYWRRILQGFTQPTDIPVIAAVDSGRDEVRRASRRLSASEAAELRELARRLRLTTSTIMQGAWAVLLARYSGDSDVLFGTTSAGRSADVPGVERMVGLLTNTIPTRVRIRWEAPVAEFLGELHPQLVELQGYEYSSLVDLQRYTNVPGDRRLFETIFVSVVQRVGSAEHVTPAGLDVSAGPDYERTGYPLVLTATTIDDVELQLAYEAGRVTDADADRLVGHYRDLLVNLVARPEARLLDLPRLPRSQAELVLDRWNRTDVAYSARSIVALFQECVQRLPDAVAVVMEERTLTYAELDAIAGRWAHRLRRVGVTRGCVVGVRLRRAITLLPVLLGIHRAGGAYLPLDPTYPAQRLSFIVDDARPAVLVSDGDQPPLPGVPVLTLDDLDTADSEPGLDAHQPAPGDLAYLIYTSGSTGRPKGVRVPHRALTNFVLAVRDFLSSDERDVWLALTSLSFDISALELFLPLVVGGRVVIAPEPSIRDGRALVQLVRRSGITHVQATPSSWQLLLAGGFDEPSVAALSGGEPLPARLAQQLQGRVGRLFNLYGPTETTVWSTAGRVLMTDTAVDVGRPIANTRVYILDARQAPVPPGATGEICIGGLGLADGYHGRSGLTAERFVPDPFGPAGGRLYRTGDRGRHGADGRIHVLDRLDNQLKIRGHRIEPAEIEACLLSHPSIREAAVAAHGAPEQRQLVAYFVTHGDPLDPASLRGYVGGQLPSYMIPAAFVHLDQMPQTPNRKLDRRRLPAPEPHAPPAQSYVAPGNDIERTLASAWATALDRERVGVHDDFFDLGGDSLRSLQIVALARRAGMAVSPDQILTHRTIARLARAAHPAVAGPAGQRVHPPGGGGVERLLFPGSPLIREHMARHRVPGAAFAVIAGGELAGAWGEGTALAGARPGGITQETVFQAGSISKHLTALAVMRLAQEGRLDLAADVGGYLRSWRLPAGVTGTPVTLRHLLSHTAGLTAAGAHGYPRSAPPPTIAAVLDGKPPAVTAPIAVQAPPGTRYCYSNSGFLVAQQLLEDVLGTPFADLMSSVLLDPLALTGSSFKYGFPTEASCVVAYGHRADGTPQDGGWQHVPEAAAAGLWTTAADLATVAMALQRAIRGESGAFLVKANAETMLTPSAVEPEYGLGTIVRSIEGQRWFGHAGDTTGYHCLSLAAEGGEGLVVMTNSDNGGAFIRGVLAAIQLGLRISP